MAESTIITVIVIGVECTSLLLVPYHRYYVIVTDIISTVFEMVFDSYNFNRFCIYIRVLGYTLQKYFGNFSSIVFFENIVTGNQFWENIYDFG